MNVLSLFDGMSCGQIALKELGYPITKYYASEINKAAIEQTKHNFPDTMHLGDVKDVRGQDLGHIDLLFAGFPCKGFSNAGKMNGFEHPETALYFELVRIYNELKEINPNLLFLLENVRMPGRDVAKVYKDFGVYPFLAETKDYLPMNRTRMFWFNWNIQEVGLWGDKHSYLPKPKPHNKVLSDFLEKNVGDEWLVDKKRYERIKKDVEIKFSTIDAEIGVCFLANMYSNWRGNYITTKKGLRRLTYRECSRLQGIPEWYEWIVGGNKPYEMIGNGWTIPVIKDILSKILPF